MQHLNANVLAAVRLDYSLVDTENAEPFELCVLPLNDMLEPHGQLPMFMMRMQLDQPPLFENLTKKDVAEAQIQSLDREKVAFLLMAWFQELTLNSGKKILPITFGWPPVRDVLVRWLGHETFNTIFSEEYRDVAVAAHFLNDREGCKDERVPFAKQSLAWIAKQLNVQRHTPGNVAEDCMTIGHCYKRLLQT